MLGNIANIALIVTSIKVLSDLLGASLGDDRQQRFRSFLERWHSALNDSEPEKMLVVPLSALANMYEKVLGPTPFSGASFKRACVLAPLLLCASLGFAGLFCNKPFAMAHWPWESYSDSIDMLKKMAVGPGLKNVGDALYLKQNLSDLATLSGWPFSVCYTIYFTIVVTFFTALLFWGSVAVSRMFLQEMIGARTLFRVFVLFFSNASLILVFGAAACLILCILLNVWTWPFVPVIFSLSKLSVWAGASLASMASLLVWFLSAPWLKLVVVLSLLPSILAALVIGGGLITFVCRRPILASVSTAFSVSLRSPKGLFSFLGAICGALVFFLILLSSFLGWLAQVSISLGSPSLFGVDYLILSLVVFLATLFSSLVRVSGRYVPPCRPIRPSGALFLFFASFFIILTGFYIQAILQCFAMPEAAVMDAHIPDFVPAIDAVIPGSVVGSVVVFSRAAGAGWVRTGLRIVLVLASFDFMTTIQGGSSYQNFAFSLTCDSVGGPAAALLIFACYRFLWYRQA